MRFFRWLLVLTLCFGLVLPCLPQTSASERSAVMEAKDISGREIVTDRKGFPDLSVLFDKQMGSRKSTDQQSFLTLEHEDGIGSLYFIFDALYGAYTITDNTTGQRCAAGETRFYHEFLDLTDLFGTAPTSVTVSFEDGPVTIAELYVYGPGQVPDTVQKWNIPYTDGADLVLFSTHGDDEQLFFAGVLPYYAVERDYRVQVVYFTDHRKDDPHRVHEMLNGLWAVGVRAYPVFGSHPDFMRRYQLEGTYQGYESRGYTREELLSFVVENIRRFKPLVAVGHDINGEYGHGMHMVYTDLLIKALEITNDPEQFPESAERYGVWDVPKTYLHLYEENPVVMDWDQPLESFGGMTAFEVTKELGYPCHVSQYRDFAWYLVHYDTAAECPKYNPCRYGLYRSTVGEDVQKNDFFENITVYRDQELEETVPQETSPQETQPEPEETVPKQTSAPTEGTAPAETAVADDGRTEAADLRQEALAWIAIEVVLLAVLVVLVLIRVCRRHR